MIKVEYFLLDEGLYRVTETNSGYIYVDSWYGFAIGNLEAVKGMWNKVPGNRVFTYVRNKGNKLNIKEANEYMEKKLMIEHLKK